MRRKISEKKLAIGLMLLVVGGILLTNTTLIDGPVRVSEKRILFSLLPCSVDSGINCQVPGILFDQPL